MHRFAPSLLDKLLGAAPHGPGGSALAFSVEQVKASVARDIETLLNARPGHDATQLAAWPRAAKSLLSFGLGDITSLNMASDRDRQHIVQAIRGALQAHEPRLSNVQVTLREVPGAGLHVHFGIHATLCLTPLQEPVAFDAVLQPGCQRYAVSSAGWRGRVPL
jgi:type VI secretion system protein ImpF